MARRPTPDDTPRATHRTTHRRRPRPTLPSRPAGLSLLEVILALALLGMALVMLGQLVRVGGRHATEARELSTGYLHCQSILDQVAAQALPTDAVQNATIDIDPDWVYSLNVQNGDLEGLISVTVIVTPVADNDPRPVTARLTRLMIDPVWMQQRQAEAEAEAAEEQAAAEGSDAAL